MDAAAQAQVVARILAPTTLCRPSLRDALAYHGAQMTAVEVETVSVAQLEAYLAGVVATIQRRWVRRGLGDAGESHKCVCMGWQGMLTFIALRAAPLAEGGHVQHTGAACWVGSLVW